MEFLFFIDYLRQITSCLFESCVGINIVNTEFGNWLDQLVIIVPQTVLSIVKVKVLDPYLTLLDCPISFIF